MAAFAPSNGKPRKATLAPEAATSSEGTYGALSIETTPDVIAPKAPSAPGSVVVSTPPPSRPYAGFGAATAFRCWASLRPATTPKNSNATLAPSKEVIGPGPSYFG